jgi:hypothetical protein
MASGSGVVKANAMATRTYAGRRKKRMTAGYVWRILVGRCRTVNHRGDLRLPFYNRRKSIRFCLIDIDGVSEVPIGSTDLLARSMPF